MLSGISIPGTLQGKWWNFAFTDLRQVPDASEKELMEIAEEKAAHFLSYDSVRPMVNLVYFLQYHVNPHSRWHCWWYCFKHPSDSFILPTVQTPESFQPSLPPFSWDSRDSGTLVLNQNSQVATSRTAELGILWWHTSCNACVDSGLYRAAIVGTILGLLPLAYGSWMPEWPRCPYLWSCPSLTQGPHMLLSEHYYLLMKCIDTTWYNMVK